jgi:L-malate glycosyltransferase
MKKILFLIDSLTRAGAERVTINLINNLNKKYKPILICVNGLGGKDNFKDELKIKPIVFDTKIRSSKDLIKKAGNIIRITKKLIEIIRKENISVIQSSLEISDMYAGILKILKPNLKIISVRHNATPLRINFFKQQITKNILKKSEKVVCISDTVLSFTKNFYGIPNNKVVKIQNSINIKEIEKSKPAKLSIKNKTIFLSVGRFVEEKNYPMLIDAFSKLKNKDSFLIIIGKGPEKNNIENLIKMNKIQKKVKIIPSAKDIFSYYKAADIFVLTPKYEGFGIVFLEAMAAELPVITLNKKPMSEFIEKDKTGFLINNTNELIKTMDFLIKDKELRTIVGKEAKKSIKEKFSIKEMANKYEKVYEDLF